MRFKSIMIFFFFVSIFLLGNNVISQKTIDSNLQKIELEVAGGYWAGIGLNHLSIFQKQNSYISVSNGIGITQGVFEFIKLSIAQKIHLGFNLGKSHSIEFGPGYALVFNLSGRSYKKEARESYFPDLPENALPYNPTLEPVYNMSLQYNYKFNQWSIGISFMAQYSYFYHRDNKQLRPFMGLSLGYLLKERPRE